MKAAGYNVAANYAGNDEAAQKFKAETGINGLKWDVSSYEACVAGLKQVQAELGPIDHSREQRRHHPRRHAVTA